MTFRRLILGLALVALPGVLHAQELTGTLKKIKDTGAITIGHRESSVPFSYLDDNQKPVGFAMDICYKIVDAVKKELKTDKIEVKLVPVTSATRIPLIANGTVDLECGSTTNNAERAKQVAYTNTHYLSESKYVTKKSSNIKSIADLKGKTIVSTAGTTNIKQANEANTAQGLGMTILPAKGPCGSISQCRDRPRGRLRDGRHPACELRGQRQGPEPLCHLHGRVLES